MSFWRDLLERLRFARWARRVAPEWLWPVGVDLVEPTTCEEDEAMKVDLGKMPNNATAVREVRPRNSAGAYVPVPDGFTVEMQAQFPALLVVQRVDQEGLPYPRYLLTGQGSNGSTGLGAVLKDAAGTVRATASTTVNLVDPEIVVPPTDDIVGIDIVEPDDA